MCPVPLDHYTVLSSLTSGGTANINVAGNMQITGALIATIDEHGNDLGQLTLNTGSLSFTDLTNIHQSNQTSGSISTSISLGGQSGTEAAQQIPTAQDGQGRESCFNTTNIAYSNTSQYDADKSLATLGSGTITVGGVQLELNGELTDAGKAGGSPLDRLNRDTTDLNKDLWSVERTEGNIDLQIDQRFFSAEGRAEVGQQFSEFGDNLQIVAQNVPAATGGNGLENFVGKVLDELGSWTGGVIPSDANAGGLIANLPGYVGVGDNRAVDILVLPPDSDTVTSGLYHFVSAEELPFYSQLSQEQRNQIGGQMILLMEPGQERPVELTTYQNSANGIMNTPADALAGGLMRTQEEAYTPGTVELTLLYNPTHGALSDALEAGIDKFLPWQTGVSRQTGESVGMIVNTRMGGDLDTNIVAHSKVWLR